MSRTGWGGDGYLIGDGGCLTGDTILVPSRRIKLGRVRSALPSPASCARRSDRGAGRLAGAGYRREPSPDLLRELPRALLGALEGGIELGVEVQTNRLNC